MNALANFLVERQVATADDIERALHSGGARESTLGNALYGANLQGSDDLAHALAEFHGVPVARADEFGETPSVDLAPAFLRANRIFPLTDDARCVTLAMADPTDQETIDAVRLTVGKPVSIKVAKPEDLDRALGKLADAEELLAEDVDDAAVPSDPNDLDHLRDLALGAPVVKFVNQLFNDAVSKRATDIHIEPFQNKVSIRLRVDGILFEFSAPPVQQARAIVSRIKILSGLNIAERRLPQDGRSRIKLENRQLDVRVATMPTIHGESVVIRLLDNVRRTLTLPALGFSQIAQQSLQQQLQSPHGMIVVTGPTGSGKTTTLATALGLINPVKQKVLTIEDPIEYELEGVNQIQAKPEIGLTFATALRSFLRHDPDVIMVGEMRDGETAGIGIHAALTGHLVLTTLHTNTAAGAVSRLLDMGVDAPLLASALRSVVGQRLVRRLCEHCKTSYVGRPNIPQPVLSAAGLGPIGPMQLWQPAGCERCNGTGYADRAVISEILTFDEKLRGMIAAGTSSFEIQQAAIKSGYRTMIIDGLEKCRLGITAPDEVMRVALDL